LTKCLRWPDEMASWADLARRPKFGDPGLHYDFVYS